MSDDGFDASAAAARAMGESSGDPTPSTDGSSSETVATDHADAEGAPSEDTMGNASRWREMLMSSDPERPLEKVESPWDPERGGPSRIYRGVQKMAGIDAVPALLDIMIGAAETVVHIQAESVDDGDGSELSADQGEDVV